MSYVCRTFLNVSASGVIVNMRVSAVLIKLFIPNKHIVKIAVFID